MQLNTRQQQTAIFLSAMTGGLRSRRQRICSWCSKSFTKDEHLARHVRTHTREKPFLCTICRKAFSRQYVLQLAWGRVDTNEVPSDSLLRHSRSHKSPRLDNGVAHNESGAMYPSLHCEKERISLSNHDLPVYLHESPRSSHQSSSIDSRFPRATFCRSTSYSFSNPTEQQSMLVSNVEEPTLTHTNGLAGFPTPGSQSNPTEPDVRLDTDSQDGSWNFGKTSTDMPAWFADDDFDLSALNSEIMMSTAQWLPLADTSQWHHEPFINTPGQPTEDMSSCREEMVQEHWFTFMGPSRTGQITPDTGMEGTQVDEAYRASLAMKLQPDIPFLPLPSTDFLVSEPPTRSLWSQLNRIESLCTNVLYQVPSRISYCACANFQTIF